MKLVQIYSILLLSINFWVLLGNEAEVSASHCVEQVTFSFKRKCIDIANYTVLSLRSSLFTD